MSVTITKPTIFKNAVHVEKNIAWGGGEGSSIFALGLNVSTNIMLWRRVHAIVQRENTEALDSKTRVAPPSRYLKITANARSFLNGQFLFSGSVSKSPTHRDSLGQSIPSGDTCRRPHHPSLDIDLCDYEHIAETRFLSFDA